ncbi:MAG: family phosphatase [Caulobacteraceae bacterium]|nr:family phosphatase [Caulobacteraceae bacterium]
MSDFRRVTDDFSVAPQIGVGDLARAAQQGFVMVINNRPDGEAPDQPSGAEIAAAAEAAGLAYVYVPIIGGPTRAQAEAVREALSEAGGPVLAFCRSGTRSINTWALGEAMSGARPDQLVAAGAEAGYDLRPLLG